MIQEKSILYLNTTQEYHFSRFSYGTVTKPEKYIVDSALVRFYPTDESYD